MPINTTETGMKEVIFGYGDVNFISTKPEENDYLNGVLFRQHHEPRPVGDRVKDGEFEGLTFNELNPEVHFIFHSAESLDVIIEHLQEIRVQMPQANESTEPPSVAEAD